MSDDNTLLALVEQAVSRDPDEPAPIRPTKDYEEIIVKDVSIGFVGDHQDLTLYPEDTWESDGTGNIRITLNSLQSDPRCAPGEFVAYSGHTQWHSLRERIHRREKGTLRPDAEKLMKEFVEAERKRRAELIARNLRRQE